MGVRPHLVWHIAYACRKDHTMIEARKPLSRKALPDSWRLFGSMLALDINDFWAGWHVSCFPASFPLVYCVASKKTFSFKMYSKAASVLLHYPVFPFIWRCSVSILALVAPLACATITINPPTNVNSNSDVTITWTSSAKGTDPYVYSVSPLLDWLANG